MTHSAAILFFSGLLVALAVLLELTVKAYWAEIVAALRGQPFEPGSAEVPQARATVVQPQPPRRAAA